MRPIRPRLLAIVAALAFSLALPLTAAGAATPGSAAAVSRWRVMQTVGPQRGVTYPDYFVTTRADSAWSWWRCNAACVAGAVGDRFAERWNGRRWLLTRMPRQAAGMVGVSASSPRNVWIISASNTRGKPVTDYAVIWNGTWHVRRIPSWVVQFSRAGFYYADPVVFGPKSVWVFSVGRTYAQFNGSRWAKKQIPGPAEEISAASADSVWVLSYQAHGDQVLLHWNGHSWRTLRIPKPAGIPRNSVEYPGDLTAAGRSNVWLARQIETGSQGARTLYLMHWNGKGWRRVHFRYPTSFINRIAPDGHGGLWLVSNGPAPSYRWYFDHLLRPGKWTRQPVPTTSRTRDPGVFTIASIPGTSSMWATGSLLPLHSTTAVVGAIFKSGR